MKSYYVFAILVILVCQNLLGQDLIPNNKFDLGQDNYAPYCVNNQIIISTRIQDWQRALSADDIACDRFSSCPTPDWMETSCSDYGIVYPEIPGNRWIVGTTSEAVGATGQEGMRVGLNNQLEAGETYTLTYWTFSSGGYAHEEHDFRVYLCNNGHFWDAPPFWAWGRKRILVDYFGSEVLSHGLNDPEIIPSPYQPVAKHWHQRRAEFVVPNDMTGAAKSLDNIILISRKKAHHFDDPILTPGGCDDPLIIDNTTFRPGVHHPYYGTPIKIGYNGLVTSEGATLTFVSPIEVQINEINVPGNEAFHVYNAPCDCESPIANPGSAAIICANDPPYQLGGSSQEWMSYSWSCEPSSGLNYLNSTTVSNPVLTAPTTGNHELVYTVTVTNTCGVSLSEDVPIVIVNAPDNTPTLSVNFFTTEWPVKIWMLPDQWMETIRIELYNYGGSTPVQTWDLLAFQDFQPGEDFFWEFQDILPICDGYTIKVKCRNMCSTVWSSVETVTVEPFEGAGIIHQLSNVFWLGASSPHDAITLIHEGFVSYSLKVYDGSDGILLHKVDDVEIVSNQVLIWDETMHNMHGWDVLAGSTYQPILTLVDCDGNSVVHTGFWTVLGGSGPSGKLTDPDGDGYFEEGGHQFRLTGLLANTIQNKSLGIHPNPNAGTFTISGTDMQQITILEASGKLVRQMAGPFGTALEVNGLSAGLYVVRVQMADGGVETGRVVVAP